MVVRNRIRILRLEKDDPQREMQFEIDFQRSLTTAQRFELMFKRSAQIRETLIRNGHRKPVEIIKR